MRSCLPAVAGAIRSAGSPVAGTPAGTVVLQAAGLQFHGRTVTAAGNAAPRAGELAVFCRPVVTAPAVVRRDAAAGTAVQENRGHAAGAPRPLVIDRMPIADVEHPGPVGIDRRVERAQRGHRAFDASRKWRPPSSIAKTMAASQTGAPARGEGGSTTARGERRLAEARRRSMSRDAGGEAPFVACRGRNSAANARSAAAMSTIVTC